MNPDQIYEGRFVNVPDNKAISIILKESQAFKPLIEQLGAEKFPNRKAAIVLLTELDWKAVPLLLESLKSKDPEVRENTRTILKKLHQHKKYN